MNSNARFAMSQRLQRIAAVVMFSGIAVGPWFAPVAFFAVLGGCALLVASLEVLP
jgi:hypothetical protein